MVKGLQNKNQYTILQQKIIGRLAEIEQEDADRCEQCGGEDCACCEYWIDRQKWQEPNELFADDNNDYSFFGEHGWHDDEYCAKCGAYLDEWCEDCNLCLDCCTCEEEN